MKMTTLTIDYPPQAGGVANYSEAVCHFFGDEMTVLSNDELHFMSDKFPKWIGALRLLLDRDDDVLMVHHILPLGLVAFLNWRRNKVPYVVFFHGMDFELAKRNAWKRFLTKKILRKAHTVVGNSKYLAKELAEFAGVEAIVVYPMPAVRAEANSDNTTDSSLAAGGYLELVSIGRFVARKGHQRVLHALAKMPHMHDKLRYTILGDDGEYVKTLRGLVDELDLREVVEIKTNSGETEIRLALAKADIFIMPTLTSPGDREGFGIVYLEAATFGVPSIASRIPGVDEAVLDGKTGILVDTDEELVDAMMALIQDRELRERLGVAAKKRADLDFAPERIFAELKARMNTI